MSHVLHYDGQYFRVDIAEVANPDDPANGVFVGWCSDAFRDLKDMPSHACSRFVGGPPLPKYADALRHAHDWIKVNWDSQKTKQGYRASDKPGARASVIYTVWLFKGDSSFGMDFEEFTDAKLFAAAAQKSLEITRVGIKNNESPQYLTVWEKD